MRSRGGADTAYGKSVDPADRDLARTFNQKMSEGKFDGATYGQVRIAMTSYGLDPTIWHVGHITSRSKANQSNYGKENKGCNLMALPKAENLALGAKQVPKTQLDFWHRGDPGCRIKV